jgi:hypothetical protein
MKTKILLLVTFLSLTQKIHAQVQGMAINTPPALEQPSAVVEITGTSGGILIPRMTEVEKNSIASPANSLLVYQKDGDHGYYWYDSIPLPGKWVKLGQESTNSCLSMIPAPAFPTSSAGGSNENSNTTAYLGEVIIPLKITANQIIVENFGATAIPGKVKIGLYSDDGQRKLFEVTTDSILNNGLIKTTLNSSVVINPGSYYIAVVPIGSTSVNLLTYSLGVISVGFLNPPGKNILQGTITVTPDTLPLNFDPTSIIFSNNKCIQFRLDN